MQPFDTRQQIRHALAIRKQQELAVLNLKWLVDKINDGRPYLAISPTTLKPSLTDIYNGCVSTVLEPNVRTYAFKQAADRNNFIINNPSASFLASIPRS